MPPKQRTGSVSKQCEECGGANPVACKICTACGADFYASANDKASSPEESSGLLDPNTTGERRRSERVKRERPDYYDALEFDNKRKNNTTPTRQGSKREKFPGSGTSGRSPKVRLDDDTDSCSSKGGHRTTSSGKRGSKHQTTTAGRATLTWKKGQDEDEDEKEKRKRKRKRDGDSEDDLLHILDELPTEKSLQCQVSLAEINRKLGAVMNQPC